MKRITLLLLSILISSSLYANLRYINYSGFPEIDEYEDEVLFILNNEYYMDTYLFNWEFDFSKEAFTAQVEEVYLSLNSLFERNPDHLDLCLFLGEISRFLYNLEAHEYYDKALSHYSRAREIDGNDYRADWFQGYFYVQATQPKEGMSLLQPIALNLRENLPPYFWTDYAIAAYQSLMLWTALDSYNMFNSYNTEDSDNLASLFTELEGNIIHPDSTDIYTPNEVWRRISFNDNNYFVSNMACLRVLENKEWEMSFNGLNNGVTAVIAKPERYEGFNKSEVGTTIVGLAAVKRPDMTLESYMSNFTKGNYQISEVELEVPFENYIAYELSDDSMYPEQGGGRFLLVGTEVEYGEHSVAGIEVPEELTGSTEGSYYQVKQLYDRFEENIFYVFFLDSCKAVYKPAKADFLYFLNENIKIK